MTSEAAQIHKSVYLFRHVINNSVIATVKKRLSADYLKQIPPHLRPTSVRVDHWAPIVAVTGFKGPRTAQALSDAIKSRISRRYTIQSTNLEHIQLPKRLRYPKDANQVENSIESLKDVIETVLPKYDNNPKIVMAWEHENYKNLPSTDKNTNQATEVALRNTDQATEVALRIWPEFVSHTVLEYKRKFAMPLKRKRVRAQVKAPDNIELPQ